jgi:hypothetical protein
MDERLIDFIIKANIDGIFFHNFNKLKLDEAQYNYK